MASSPNASGTSTQVVRLVLLFIIALAIGTTLAVWGAWSLGSGSAYRAGNLLLNPNYAMGTVVKERDGEAPLIFEGWVVSAWDPEALEWKERRLVGTLYSAFYAAVSATESREILSRPSTSKASIWLKGYTTPGNAASLQNTLFQEVAIDLDSERFFVPLREGKEGEWVVFSLNDSGKNVVESWLK